MALNDEFEQSSIILAPEVIKLNIIVFFTGMFFINNFFDMRDTKMKMTPSCSPGRAGSIHVLFDLEGSISKFDLRSGEGQIMIQ